MPPNPPGTRSLGYVFLTLAFLAGLAVTASAYTRALEPLTRAERVCNDLAPNGVDSPERHDCIQREMRERVEPWAIPLVGSFLIVGVGFLLFGKPST